MPIAVSPDLAQRVKAESGENVYLCYQCQKCTSGCPVAAYFDLAPHQILRACQFGQTDLALNSRTIWLCAACETCTTRCPQGIDIARIMDVLRIMAQQSRIKSKAPAVPIFYRAFNRSIRWFGRLYEAGLMGELYMCLLAKGALSLRQLFRYDLPLAWKMLRRGKLKLLPHRARGRAASQTIDSQAIAYYPGCSLHGTGIEYELSTRAVTEKLNLKLVEPPGWKCCGASAAHATDHLRALQLPLETLAIAQAMGQDYLTMPCAACFSRFRIAQHEIAQDPQLRALLAEKTGYRANHGVRVENLLTTMADRVGLQRIRQAVTRPLNGLKVVCYYGCLLTRPPAATEEPEYEYPTKMDRLVETLGARSLDWSYKTECCGGSLSLSQLSIALNLSRKILQNAQDVGADAIIVACPLCHANLDLRQRQINEQYGTEFRIPIVYFTQVMGLAFGIEPRQLGLEKNFTSTAPLLSAVGFGAICHHRQVLTKRS